MGKKTRKNKRKKVSPKLSKYILQLTKSKYPDSTFSQIRKTVPDNSIDSLVTWIYKSVSFRDKTIGNKYPQKLENWGKSAVPESSPTTNEFLWACSILKRHVDSINIFIQLSNSFIDYFLLERYSECGEILDTVEKQFGYSIWLIEKRIILLQHTDGLEAQKKYCEKITKVSYSFTRIPFITHFISHRTEPTVSPGKFASYFQDYLDSLDLNSDTKSYLLFHILHKSLETEQEINNTLRLDLNASVIDYYNSFVQLSEKSLISSEFKDKGAVKSSILTLSKIINDTRLETLSVRFCGKRSTSIGPTTESVENFNLFISGAFDNSLQNSLEAINKTPTDISSIYLILLICSLTNKKITKKELKAPNYLYTLVQLFTNESLKDEWKDLANLAFTARGSGFALFLSSIINREYNFHPLASVAYSSTYSFLNFVKLEPIFLFWLDNSQERTVYFNLILTNLSPSIEVTTIGDFHTIDNIGEHYPASCWVKIKDNLECKNFDSVLPLTSDLETSLSHHYKRNALKAKLYTLYELKLHGECITEIVDQYILKKANINILPIEEIYTSLSKEIITNLSPTIEYVILTSLFVTYIDTTKQYLRSDSCEDFLTFHGISRPSQMQKCSDQFEKQKLIYFLKDVCIESTMDTWVEFHSSQDVAKERVEICRFIIDIEPSLKDDCQSEILEIMQKIKIKERLREIDQSKIYVDVESVKKVAQIDLKDSFKRYTSFLSSGMSHEDIEVREKASQALAGKNLEEIFALKFPRHEMSNLFTRMIVRLRDEFVSSNQHGLDGYLSVRIRHNTLAGQLLNPFENENLLVYKDSHSNTYRKNEYWFDQLDLFHSTRDSEILTEALISFKESFEKLVNTIRNDWIQIKKTNEDTGLIDFRLIDKEVDYLSTFINKDTSLNYFIDEIVQYFFTSKLEHGLSTIRNRLQNDAKPQVHQMLNQLQASCESISVDISRLRTSIGHARTNAQVTIDRITEWFRLSFIEKLEVFSIEEAISISDASIKTACPGFNCNYLPSEEMKSFFLKGNITNFVDIIFIAFDNIVQHSGDSTLPKASILSNYSNKMVHIRIENSVNYDRLEFDAIKKRVEDMKNEVIKKPFSKSVTKEGGTGFYKIHKILHHDFSSIDKDVKPLLDFGFTVDDVFFVQVSIPILSVQWRENA